MTKEEAIVEIKRIIKEKIRPALVMDGGNIEYVDYTDDGIVKVKLLGACHGCPLSAVTLKNMVEETLKEYIPDIKSVEKIELEDNELNEDELEF